MTPEEMKINDALLYLIDEHGLNANDIADVIAEQVTGAKNSSSDRVRFVADRLERRFGSKVQSRDTTPNYNAKADNFGGYFLSFLLSYRQGEDKDGIAIALDALENAYEVRKSLEDSEDLDQNSEHYIEWNETPGTTMSSEMQDEMLDVGSADMSRAVTSIHYRDDIRDSFIEITKLPINFQLLFLEVLNEDPSILSSELKNSIIESHRLWANPYEIDSLNRGLMEARKLGEKAEEDYLNIVNLIGVDVNVDRILSDLRKKFPITSANLNQKDKAAKQKEIEARFNKSINDLAREFGVKEVGIGYERWYKIGDSSVTYATKFDAVLEVIADELNVVIDQEKTIPLVTENNYQKHLEYLLSLKMLPPQT